MRTLIGIPTLNEGGNIQELLQSLYNELPRETKILVVDDSSTDGSAEYLFEQASLGRINLLSRPPNLGIGSAHKAIISFAAENRFEILASMDADGTHSVYDLNRLLSELNTSTNDLIIGSRFADGGELKDWPKGRRLTSKLANFVTKTAIGRDLDCTSGLRAYRLQTALINSLLSVPYNDYRFFYRSIFTLGGGKVEISEIPVTLNPRKLGNSKMSTQKKLTLASSMILDALKHYSISKSISQERVGL